MFVRVFPLAWPSDRLHRFDYGDYNPTNHTNGTPFVQMVSTVDPHSAMDEFTEGRAELLAILPPTIEPSVFVKAPLSPSATGQANATTTDAAVRGALSEDDEDGASSSGGLGKYGVVALALLGANLLVAVLIFAVTLTMCVRGVKGKSRDLGSRYTPVRFKEAAESDPESGPLGRYSDQ